ncbi:MAG: FAD:protein FMN transferase [Alicyclobacillaceae bacterium]|nr:FAD:protein FMN transferase [Alicyclobacillaceae bacterium]
MAVYEHHFRSMASPVQVRLDFRGADRPSYRDAATAVARLAETAFSEAVRTMSRFDPDSELSRLNRAPGEWREVSPLLYNALRRAWEAYRFTGGVFDPRVLDSLEQLGYRGSPLERPASPPPPEQSDRGESDGAPWIEFGDGCRIKLRRPVDLGGIGKSLTVDRVRLAILEHFGGDDQLAGFLVNAGGDLYAWGSRDTGEPWTIGIEDPLDPSAIIAALRLETPTAVCTSSVARRRWIHDGKPVHHLIDPETGLPADSPYLSVTCAYPDPAAAEVFTKCYLIRPDVSLRVWPFPEYIWWVTTDGRLFTTPQGAKWVAWNRQRSDVR